MKKTLLFLAVFLCANYSVFAGGEHMAKPYVGTPEFERLKTLAGSWKGKHIESDGKESDVNVEYSVSSNGSILVEKLAPGTPHEMISIYRDKKGKAAFTHYCAIGNQPEMDLISSSEKEMKFDFSPSNNLIDPAKDEHMHALTLNFDGNDKLTQTWKYFKGGAQAGETVITLTRQNS